MDVTFNFIGMNVVDWHRSYTFFTQTLGLQAELNPAYGDWANLGAAWDGYYSETHSLVCELFDQGKPVSERWWGHHQSIRPAIHVNDLESIVAQLRMGGVNFTGVIEHKSWGRQIEFDTVEGIRWTLAQVPGKPVRPDFSRPQFGHVAIKTADFEAQKRFYGNTMGFILEDSGTDYAIYGQNKPNHPFIILEPGGESARLDPRLADNPERSYPIHLSFMTPHIQATALECDKLGIRILRQIIKHDDWGGTDIFITDADGNGIQVVQYS